MPRLPVTSSFLGRSSQLLRPFSYRLLARAATQWAGGRPKEDHVVNRTDANDIQAEASQSGMRQKREGKKDSQAISQKDEGNFNTKAKEDHPKAPTPVIGMNDERGGKGHK